MCRRRCRRAARPPCRRPHQQTGLRRCPPRPGQTPVKVRGSVGVGLGRETVVMFAIACFRFKPRLCTCVCVLRRCRLSFFSHLPFACVPLSACFPSAVSGRGSCALSYQPGNFCLRWCVALLLSCSSCGRGASLFVWHVCRPCSMRHVYRIVSYRTHTAVRRGRWESSGLRTESRLRFRRVQLDTKHFQRNPSRAVVALTLFLPHYTTDTSGGKKGCVVM